MTTKKNINRQRAEEYQYIFSVEDVDKLALHRSQSVPGSDGDLEINFFRFDENDENDENDEIVAQ